MNYWNGQMNWPIEKGWKCEMCGENYGLEWGMVHGECRCNNCHISYSMRDENKELLTKPRCLIKEEYREKIKKLIEQGMKSEEITKEDLL